MNDLENKTTQKETLSGFKSVNNATVSIKKSYVSDSINRGLGEISMPKYDLRNVCIIKKDGTKEPYDVQKVVEAVINDHKEDLLQQRYEYPINHLLFSVREGRMKWADGKQVKTIFDE